MMLAPSGVHIAKRFVRASPNCLIGVEKQMFGGESQISHDGQDD
jgi:hypothetical protein